MGNFTSTFYVPGGNGWTSGNYYCRFKVEQTYTSSTNKSVFKITPQFKMPASSNGETVIAGTISVNGTTLKNFSDARYRANFFSDGWTDIVALYSGDPTSWSSSSLSHNADGSISVTFAVNSLVVQQIATFNGTASGGLSGDARTYTLTISAGPGSTVTVKKGSTTLSNGATITYGDTLTVTAAAQSGYTLSSFKINGADKTSPATVTVSGAVSVAATADAQALVSLYVSSTWADYSTYIYTSGAFALHQPFIYTSGEWKQY